jgi:hypothetical protein
MATAFTGTIPAGALADVSTLFSGLYEFAWKGVSAPTSLVTFEFRQDLAIHKFADRDGAHIEGTGRAPMQFTAHIPFYNGLFPAASETWSQPLYPNQWRAFVSACADRTAGPLQHPELGPINCKLEHFRSTLSADRRTGQLVECVFLESDDTASQLQTDLGNNSPLANVAAFASDLDGQLATAPVPGIPALPTFPLTFTALANFVKGAIDSTTIMQKQFAGQIDNIVYQANAVQNSLDMASNSLNWPIYRNLGGLRSAAMDAKLMLLAKGRAISQYTVPKDSTFGQLASSIPANLSDLIVLNRLLAINPVVPRDAVVRFYALNI